MFKKKALLIGVQGGRELNALKSPHKDVQSMCQLLIDVYKYSPQDIVVLIDDAGPGQKQPTRENILIEIDNLVKDAQEHDRFFFQFAGHSDQMDTDDIKEEDRKDEFILTSDGEQIIDNELRAKLAKPLPTGSALIAVFDSCHSGTLLDLNHYRCNRVYVPWISKGDHSELGYVLSQGSGNFSRNQTSFEKLTDGLGGVLNSSHDSLPNHTEVPTGDSEHIEVPSVLLEPSSSISAVTMPVAMYCTGINCHDDWKLYAGEDPLDAYVISISSAQDNQLSWEDPLGRSMTQILVDILREIQHPTYRELMTRINHEFHDFYVKLHAQARTYKRGIDQINAERIKKGKKPLVGVVVEMDNFQEPQLSSDRPLDMSRQFDP